MRDLTVDDVEHVQDAAHAGRLDLYGGQAGLGLALVQVIHLLLQHHGLLGEVLQTLPGLLGLVVLVTQLGLVDGEGLLLVGEGRPEVSHAALGPSHQVIRNSDLQK